MKLRQLLSLILIISMLEFPLLANAKLENYKFFKDEAKTQTKDYKYNPYENIISGIAAFVIGNIGFFTTDNRLLKLAYSGAQTIGVINVSKGVYEYYRPLQEKHFYDLLKSYKAGNKAETVEYFSSGIISVLAKEERAKRLSILYGSAFLTGQYTINSFVGQTESSLKDIYLFLASVNLIVLGVSIFHKGKYESFYFDEMKLSAYTPVDIRGNQYTGLRLDLKF